MKTIHNINKWSFIITLFLYLSVIGGLLAQIVLGVVQVILGLNLLFNWKNLSSQSKKHVSVYWMIVLLYGFTWLILDFSFRDSVGFIYFMLIPMSIASYFVYITYQIKKNSYEPKLDYL
ncbi:hypothetical protein [uncultured Aquimarina sp.]|uniref:hypothetical protein n=1 Tax=uncultured Aquimarina sp. TaxID=575652 RepID=UPI002626F433|nr:hypothetical protein [uncultured Aquimarina sp.]